MISVSKTWCEFSEHPLGLATARPRLSWDLVVAASGEAASSYQILVASDMALLDRDIGDLWDSGKNPMPRGPLIEYDGKQLRSRQQAWWKVRVWDTDGNPGPYSEFDHFELALLEEDDWAADWLGYLGSSVTGALYLRRPFSLDLPVMKARLYVTGTGFYDVRINGDRVGRQFLEPAPTDNSKRVLYSTFDVSEMLKPGENVLVGILGHGWSGAQKLLAQLEIHLSDGTALRICSDNAVGSSGWTAYKGPIVEDSIYDGETYDSRLEDPSWERSGGDSSETPMQRLGNAMVVDAPGGVLEARSLEAVEVVETRAVLDISQPAPGVYVVDTGQNLAGWLRLLADGPAGREITLRYAESLYGDGRVNQENLRSARATDRLILNGNGPRVWQPTFTYHGFRYVQVEGYPGELGIDAVTVSVVRTAIRTRGQFSCDSEQINALSRAVFWTEASNLCGVPTDCPQRNERMGWLNDMAARTEELVYSFDTTNFLPKWMKDIEDTQDREGAISDTAPYRYGSRPADPVSVCYGLIPWLMITHHGDFRTAERHYDGICRWYHYLSGRAIRWVVSYSHYGDWAPPIGESAIGSIGSSALPSRTPGPLVSTGHFYLLATLLSRIAHALGRESDSLRFATDAQSIRHAFNAAFYDSELMCYGTGNQACNALALYFDMVPDEHVGSTVAALVGDIEAHDKHLTTGNLCTKYVLEALVDHGHADLALELVRQNTYPSWGYMLERGATTIWERWEEATGDGMNSHNHPMYASVGAWFYRRLAGIQVPDDSIGMSRVVFQPELALDLGSASASLLTVRGPLRCAWQRTTSGTIVVSLDVPVGTASELRLPPDMSIVSAIGHASSERFDLDASVFSERPVALSGGCGYRFEVRGPRVASH